MSADYLPVNHVAAADQLRSLAVDLETQEAVIERGLQSFLEVGQALATIRDDRLYRQEYSSFEVYCQQRWQLSRPRAYQLIDAATVIAGMEAAIDLAIDSAEMSTIVDTPLPANEAQARALSGLTPDEAVAVMRDAHDATNGKPTAAAIRDARHGTAAETGLQEVARRIREGDSDLAQAADALRSGGWLKNEADALALLERERELLNPIVPEQELPPLPENYMVSDDSAAQPISMPARPAPKPSQQESAPRRRPLTDAAREIGLDLKNITSRMERLLADDRFARNKSEVAPHLRHHLAEVIRVCQDLNHQIDN